LGRDIVAANKRGEDKVLYDAPAVLLFHVSPYADAADAVIACTYAMIAAEALALGSCMIGCVAPPLARNRKLCAKHGIPAGHKPALVLILGHPAISYQRAIRRRFSTAAKIQPIEVGVRNFGFSRYAKTWDCTTRIPRFVRCV
jgi:nitroreductase